MGNRWEILTVGHPSTEHAENRAEQNVEAVVLGVHDTGDRHAGSGESRKEDSKAPPKVTSLTCYTKLGGQIKGEEEKAAKS